LPVRTRPDPAGNIGGITISGLADGANPLTFAWNLVSPSGGGTVTQVAGPSATSSTQQDGFSSGTLVSYIIQSDGTIQGTFSNGQTSALGQIALASFTNEQGLIRNGQNEFLASLSSGQANVGGPGTGGRGTLSGGALEQLHGVALMVRVGGWTKGADPRGPNADDILSAFTQVDARQDATRPLVIPIRCVYLDRG